MNYSTLIFVISLLFVQVDFSLSLRKSCGPILTQRLSRICETLGGYNSDFVPIGRNRRSIVEECCRSVCSDRSISQYCRNPSYKEYESDVETEISPPIPSMLEAETTSVDTKIVETTGIVPETLDTTTEYRPIRFGTVSPEFTKNSMLPNFSRLFYIRRINGNNY